MDIERLISNYKLSAEAADLVKRVKILLLVGITGAGKDTIKHELLNLGGYEEIISHTTRQPRMNEGVLETDGEDYHFVSSDQVQEMLVNKEFIEAKLVHGDTVYGTSVEAVRKAGKVGVALTDVDVQGVEEYKSVSEDVMAVFLIPPSFDEWVNRLKRRYSGEEEFGREWVKRRESAIKELEEALSKPYYRYVINDTIDSSVAVISEIINNPSRYTRRDDEAKLVARDLLQQIKM